MGVAAGETTCSITHFSCALRLCVQVAAYGDAASIIAQAALTSTNMSRLAYLVDTFGPRYRGTKNLEDALDWVISDMQTVTNLQNVRAEPVYNITSERCICCPHAHTRSR